MRSPVAARLALALSVALLAAADAVAQPAPAAPKGWQACCGLPPWAQAGPMKGKDTYGGWLFRGYSTLVAGSTVRHNAVLKGGIPAPYEGLRNPLPPTRQNAQRGASVYTVQCASCHGVTGLGDGPEAHRTNPPPAELGWLTKVPPSRRDGFMFWSIAEGGDRFGTGMPAYKGKLSDEDIWAVIGYIQARLPAPKGAAR
jgi:mono/diheme cytochrome c family protein